MGSSKGCWPLLFEEFADALVILADLMVFVFEEVLFFFETGTLIMLDAFGVTKADHCHLPLDNAQDCPSFAETYLSVKLILLPNGSTKDACDEVLLSVKPVSSL